MMQISQRFYVQNVASASALALGLMLAVSEADAAPVFYSTSAAEAAHWQVSTMVGGIDGSLSSFSTANFQTAVAISARPDWIANNSSGTNGGVGTWTFFVFRQTFDLTGYDPTTANLQFQWAADDSGEGFASRGTWRPKYSLNNGSLINGTWATGATYSFGPTVELSSGFASGLNTIDFYVEGNGRTDGFALQTVGFTAQDASTPPPVPEPETYAMLLAGLGLLGFTARRNKKRAA